MMASLEMNNSITALLSDFQAAFEDSPQLHKQILNAQADIVEPALRSSISSEGLVDTGMLRSSIGRSSRKRGTEIRIGPSGVHHRSVTRAGVAQELRNGHLGYIFEYGAPGRGIRPRRWMSKTVSRVRGKALDAAETVNDQYLKKHNL